MHISTSLGFAAFAAVLYGMHPVHAGGLTIHIGETGTAFDRSHPDRRDTYSINFRDLRGNRLQSGNLYNDRGVVDNRSRNRRVDRYNGYSRCDALCLQDRTNGYYRTIRRQNENYRDRDYNGYRSYQHGYRDGFQDGRRSSVRDRDHHREGR